MFNDIKNQVLKDGSIVAPWTYSTTWLNTIDDPFDPDCFMQAWGNIKWSAAKCFAPIHNGKHSGWYYAANERTKFGQSTNEMTLQFGLNDVSEHVLIPITVNLDTGQQELVRTPRGCISPKYKFEGHQPTDVARFFAAIQRRTPLCFEWAGILGDNAEVFAVASVGEPMHLYNGEEVHKHIIASNGFLGAGIFTGETLHSLCANAHRTILHPDHPAFRYTHRKGIDIDELIKSFTKHVDFDFSHVVENALKMARFNLTIDQRDRYFERCLCALSGTRYGKKVSSFNELPEGKQARANSDLRTLVSCYWNGNGQETRDGLDKAFNAWTFFWNHLSFTRAGVKAATARNAPQMLPGGTRDKAITVGFDHAMDLVELRAVA